MRYVLLIIVCHCATAVVGQPWTKITALPATDFCALEQDNNMLYAATFSNLIYRSPDNGATWTPATVSATRVTITSLAVFDHNLYAGTNADGVFISNDSGRTWHGSNPLFTVISFAEWHNKLYASTLGGGIVRYNPVTDSWTSFNTNLPNYAANADQVLDINDTLTAFAGANGTFYRFNPVTLQWDEHFYFGFLRPGLQVEQMLNDQHTLLGAAGAVPLRSDDLGTSWYFDTLGLKKQFPQLTIVAAGDTHLYTAVNPFTGGTWIQQKTKAIPGFTQAWQAAGDFIPSGLTYAIREIGASLFLCRSDGLFYRDMTTAVTDLSSKDDVTIKIYPNPSAGNNITVKSNRAIDEINVINLAGITVFKIVTRQTEYRLPMLPPGMYMIQVKTDRTLCTSKIIVE